MKARVRFDLPQALSSQTENVDAFFHGEMTLFRSIDYQLTRVACGATSRANWARISSAGIPLIGSGSSNSVRNSAGVAGEVTGAESSLAACSLISFVTARPKDSCCSLNDSLVIYSLQNRER